MAARKKARGKKGPAELIISKSRTKNAVKKCNVGGGSTEPSTPRSVK